MQNPEGKDVILKDDLIKIADGQVEADAIWADLIDKGYIIANDRGEYAANRKKLENITIPSTQMQIDEKYKQKSAAIYNILKKSVALIIYASVDGNDAFTSSPIKGLIETGYTVIYYEKTEDTEAINNIIKAGQYIQKTSSNKSPVSINIGGHGSKEEDGTYKLSLGSPIDDVARISYPEKYEQGIRYLNEIYYLDPSDKDEIKNSKLDSYTNGSIITLV